MYLRVYIFVFAFVLKVCKLFVHLQFALFVKTTVVLLLALYVAKKYIDSWFSGKKVKTRSRMAKVA